MSLFSKKPKSIADFEKEIEKLRQKKKLSARNSERLEEYEKQLSSLKTAEEAEQKKKVRQKKIAIGSIAASVALVTCIIIAGCISERGTAEPPAVSPGYTVSDSSTGTTPSDTSLDIRDVLQDIGTVEFLWLGPEAVPAPTKIHSDVTAICQSSIFGFSDASQILLKFFHIRSPPIPITRGKGCVYNRFDYV